MTRLAITPAAYAAIAGTLLSRKVAVERKSNAKGERPEIASCASGANGDDQTAQH